MGKHDELESHVTVQPDKSRVYKLHKVTEEHFDIYKKEVEAMIDLLGLHNVTIFFQFCKDKEFRASCSYTADHRATFALSTVWFSDGPPSKADIQKVARHEVAHCLIGRIHLMAMQRDLNNDELSNELEAYANRLEHAFTTLLDAM